MHGGKEGDRRVGVIWHARFGQELVDALLRGLHHRRTGHGESDAGFPDRSKRPGRSTLRPVPALPRNPAPDSGAGGFGRAFAETAQRRERWRGFPTIQNSCRKRKAAQRRSSPSAGTALERSDSQAHFQTHSRSKTVAKPCPTPTQSDAMPREAPVRAIWWISVVARRAPLQPSG